MKNNNQNILFYILPILFVGLFSASKASAVCPICTIAVGAGVGFSRYIGIDDAITGLWVGGLIVSMIVWTLSWFDKKNFNFKARGFVTTVAYLLFTLVPLYFSGLIGNPANSVCACGVDKLLISIVVGAVAFWAGAEWYYFLKARNNGHAYFPFQKVAMPIAPLIILSIIYYFLTK